MRKGCRELGVGAIRWESGEASGVGVGMVITVAMVAPQGRNIGGGGEDRLCDTTR